MKCAVGRINPKAVRYGERSTVERVDARLKDEFGGRQVWVRGHAKMLCDLLCRIWHKVWYLTPSMRSAWTTFRSIG